ncbi:MAG: phage head closure protein [Oscillospiraceae bacterium]|nr:phage head closure protein [Oscillospiraceae bacterium]
MNISGLRVRITIQKNETVTDRYGNHKSVWQDFFTCWATAVTSGLSSSEEEAAGHTVEADRLDMTVRWSSETAAVDSKGYRILLGDRIYNILSIDEMGFRHNSRKLHTELSER